MLFITLQAEKNSFTSEDMLSIMSNMNSTKKFLEKMKSLPLPAIKVAKIKFVSKRRKGYESFLSESFTNIYGSLYFSTEDLIYPNYCFRNIIKISSRISKEVMLDKLKISRSQLKHILKSCAHVSYLVLKDCTVSVPEIPELSTCLKDTKITRFSLLSCSFLLSCCKSYVALMYLLEGISSTDMKKSLQVIKFERNENLTKLELKQILDK
mmetsp:Transcript_30233/g.29726  ORF Transcript_30233/g.29726 Transcript_30233/m.29726 type:complete len:210 (+) Transcript_30233:554-1183(+)